MNKNEIISDFVWHDSGHHRYGGVTVRLPTADFDLTVEFPGGQSMQLQFRIEAPSFDVCLPENLGVINWQGIDMEPALADDRFKDGHVRLAQQLVVGVNPSYYPEIVYEEIGDS